MSALVVKIGVLVVLLCCSCSAEHSTCIANHGSDSCVPELASLNLLQSGLHIVNQQALEELEEPTGPHWKTVTVTEPWHSGLAALVQCAPDKEEEAPALVRKSTEQDERLQSAAATMCKAGLGDFVQFYVDPRFQANYDRLKGKDGWIEKAFVTYMKLNHEKSTVGAEEDLLVQSADRFSKYPVVLTYVGDRVPRHLTPERFPSLVLMRALKSASEIGKDFNFNKLNAMLFTKVKTGIVLDADQWVSSDVDTMFQRAAEETTVAYPYPILPSHFSSRDPASGPTDYTCYAFHFNQCTQCEGGSACKDCKEVPKRTMAWGHAHPTWTHHALPWLAKWVSFAMAPEKTGPPEWFKKQLPSMTDEDLLNLGSWADGLTKQWCKFDVEGTGMFEAYLAQVSPMSGDQHVKSDNKFYPRGIPHAYYTAHDAKDPKQSFAELKKLWKPKSRLPINYDERWFADGKALKEYDPTLKCII